MTDKEPCELNLLESVFPGILANIRRGEAMGFPWDNRPVLKQVDGEVLSHVGILDYPLVIEGRPYRAACLNAICTHPDARGRGYASELIREALRLIEGEYECALLFTAIPDFYARLGFRPVQEYRFHLACAHAGGSSSSREVHSPQDDALVRRLCERRAPLSNRMWVQDRGWITSFTALFATSPTYWSLHYTPSLDALLSYEVQGKTLHLLDVIAENMPSLEEVLEHIPHDLEEVYFYFSPDPLTQSATAEPHLYHRSQLMVHGDWPGLAPFMMQPLARG